MIRRKPVRSTNWRHRHDALTPRSILIISRMHKTIKELADISLAMLINVISCCLQYSLATDADDFDSQTILLLTNMLMQTFEESQK